IAAHLERCTLCREQLLDLLAFTATQGAVPAATRARWVGVTATQGERLLEVVGEFVVRVRRGAAALVEWPAGLEPVPVGVVAVPMRGPDQTTLPAGGEGPGQRFQLDLGDSDVAVDLVMEPHGDRVRMSLLVVRGDR